MTSLESLVTDLATSQQLQKAGFPQDTALVWGKHPRYEEPAVIMGGCVAPYVTILCAAPTAEEILKELPANIGCYDLVAMPYKLHSCCPDTREATVGWRDNGWGYIGYRNPEGDKETSYVQAAAQAYLWWKKEVAG